MGTLRLVVPETGRAREDTEIRPDSRPSEANPRPAVVLVVEQDRQLRPLLARALAAAGYEVVTADTRAAAIARVEARGAEPPAVLVTCLHLPDASGELLADELEALVPGLRTLFVSGSFVNDGGLHRGRPALRKPFAPSLLRASLAALLAARSIG